MGMREIRLAFAGGVAWITCFHLTQLDRKAIRMMLEGGASYARSPQKTYTLVGANLIVTDAAQYGGHRWTEPIRIVKN